VADVMKRDQKSIAMAPVETVESSGPSMWDAASHNEIPKEHWCVSFSRPQGGKRRSPLVRSLRPSGLTLE
jgi:hypothetical protein